MALRQRISFVINRSALGFVFFQIVNLKSPILDSEMRPQIETAGGASNLESLIDEPRFFVPPTAIAQVSSRFSIVDFEALAGCVPSRVQDQ